MSEHVLNALRDISPGRHEGETYPHKALLVLLAMSRIAKEEPRLTLYKDLEHDFNELLELAGVEGSSLWYPFSWLRSDGIWELEADIDIAKLKLKADSNLPLLSELRRYNARGGFVVDVHAELSRNRKLLRQAVELVSEQQFPQKTRELLLQRLALASQKPPMKSPQLRYWALSANPERYDIERAVAEKELDWWTTKGSALGVGDQVIIWKQLGDSQTRGIIAFGEVASQPEEMDDVDNHYWLDPESAKPVEARVSVRYRKHEGLPLWIDGPHRETVEALSVTRAHGGTVFKVTEEQWHAVRGAIVEGVDPSPPSDPAHVEVIEALARRASTPADLEAVELELKRWPAATEIEPKERIRFIRSITRNQRLARLVKMREGYRCQICGFEGFEKPSGELFAEAHHVEELAAGGGDVPTNILCVCPTCHRRIHYGKRGLVFSEGEWGFARQA